MYPKMAFFVSGQGTNIKYIFDNIKEYNNIIKIVISNKHCKAIDLAKEYNVKTAIFEYKNRQREDVELEIIQCLEENEIEFIFLCGFMKIITSQFVLKYQNKIFNLHPSILPSFKGAKAIEDSYYFGSLVIGSTIHVVTEKLDEGKILAQSCMPRMQDINLDDMKLMIKAVENILMMNFMICVMKMKNLKNIQYLCIDENIINKNLKADLKAIISIDNDAIYALISNGDMI